MWECVDVVLVFSIEYGFYKATTMKFSNDQSVKRMSKWGWTKSCRSKGRTHDWAVEQVGSNCQREVIGAWRGAINKTEKGGLAAILVANHREIVISHNCLLNFFGGKSQQWRGVLGVGENMVMGSSKALKFPMWKMDRISYASGMALIGYR